MNGSRPTRREIVLVALLTLIGSMSGWLASLLPTTIAWIVISAVIATGVGVCAVVARRLRRSTRRLDADWRANTRRLDENIEQLSETSERLNAVSQEVTDVTQRLLVTVSHVGSLSNGLAYFIDVSSGVADELYELARNLGNRAALVDEKIATTTKDLERANRRYGIIFRRLEEVTNRFATKQSLGEIEKRAIRLHRLSSLSGAYRLSDRRRPSRVIILMTVERSGSTALFDLFRSHPSIYLEPLSFLWEELGIDGRRYPTSLSDQGRYTLPFEVQPGIGAQIPVLDVHQRSLSLESTIAIEKAHPQFVGYDPDRLLEGISRVREAGTEVSVVLQVRRPLDVMWSMAEYKRREPSWYAALDPVDIPAYVLTSFESLTRFAEHIPAVHVIDNADLSDVSPRLIDLVQNLAPSNEDQTAEWVERTFGRLTTMQQDTPFLAERDAVRSPQGPDGIWAESSRIITEATSLWERLLERR